MFLLGGKYLEPFWGKSEYLKFIAVVGALSGTSTFIVFLTVFFMTGDEAYWFGVFFAVCIVGPTCSALYDPTD
jgi:membrane associated rhomboid family serine protease